MSIKIWITFLQFLWKCQWKIAIRYLHIVFNAFFLLKFSILQMFLHQRGVNMAQPDTRLTSSLLVIDLIPAWKVFFQPKKKVHLHSQWLERPRFTWIHLGGMSGSYSNIAHVTSKPKFDKKITLRVKFRIESLLSRRVQVQGLTNAIIFHQNL